MTIQRLALCIIAVALAVAELVRPTTFHAKHVSHTSLLGMTARPALDQTELDDLPPIVTPALGNIDGTFLVEAGKTTTLVPGATVPSSATIRIVGWCADPQARAPGSMLLAIVDAKRRLNVTRDYGRRRDDVARDLATPALSASGFDVDLPAAELGPGPHDLRVAVVTVDERAINTFPAVVSLVAAKAP
jgi:hypothetical protein